MKNHENGTSWEVIENGGTRLQHSVSAPHLVGMAVPANIRSARILQFNGNAPSCRSHCTAMAKLLRACTTRKIGLTAAAVLASISVLMVVNGSNFLSRRPGAYEELQRAASIAADFPDHRSTPSKASRKQHKTETFESTMKVKPMGVKTNHNLIEEKQHTPSGRAKWREAVVVVDISKAPFLSRTSKQRRSAKQGASSDSKPHVAAAQSPSPSVLPPPPPPPSPPPSPPPFVPYELDLPSDHMCAKFAYPPPAVNRRKSGFRPCAVCYLPLEASIAAMPPSVATPSEVVRELTYVNKDDEAERTATEQSGKLKFGGHPSWANRTSALNDLKEKMHVHCGFVPGLRPGDGTGFDFSEEDRSAMEACRGVVVASAIFGSYDVMNQPSHISERSKRDVCFFMFLDAQTHGDFVADGTLSSAETQKVGLWRIVRVTNIPYTDPRRTGKIPKLLLHRLFPNARFSLWVDGKLELVVDPYRVLERFLWRHNHTWAISRHYKRFDVFVEAEANKVAGKYDNSSIDEQVETYRKDGLLPYTDAKLPITSDVPEGCLIIREHTPLTNLMGCLWFNEVDRFTSRDQLSFGYVRDKLMQHARFRLDMFQDCERRNFVVQKYHKELLLTRSKQSASVERQAPGLPAGGSPPALSGKDASGAPVESLVGVPVLDLGKRVRKDRKTEPEERSEKRPREGKKRRRLGKSEGGMRYVRVWSEQERGPEKETRRKGL